MTVRVAGHEFASLDYGARCLNPAGCQGVRSLSELCSMADLIRVGETRVAHIAGLTDEEIRQIKEARDAIRKRVEMAMTA